MIHKEKKKKTWAMDQTKAVSDKSTPLRPLQEKRLLHRYETQLYTGGKTHFGRKHWRKKTTTKRYSKVSTWFTRQVKHSHRSEGGNYVGALSATKLKNQKPKSASWKSAFKINTTISENRSIGIKCNLIRLLPWERERRGERWRKGWLSGTHRF